MVKLMRFCLLLFLRGRKHEQGQGTTAADEVLAVPETSKSTMIYEMNDISQTLLYAKGLTSSNKFYRVVIYILLFLTR